MLESFSASAPAAELRHGHRWDKVPAMAGRSKGSGSDPPLLAQIWATCIELLPVAQQAQAYSRFSQFFELMQEFLLLGPETLAWAAKAGGLNQLLEIVHETKSVALITAMQGARRWYQPNWLHIPSTTDAKGSSSSYRFTRPVAAEVVLGVSMDDEVVEIVMDASGMPMDPSGIEDASLERRLHSDNSGDGVELGLLWSCIAQLLGANRRELQREDMEALLRRLVRLGGATVASLSGASRLLRLLCDGDLARSQSAVCIICERIEESEGQALRGALRMGTALVALSDGLIQRRCAFLLKSVLHVAKNNRKHFRTMQLVIFYIVRWCRRRREIPQWFAADCGGSNVALTQYRWLEAWTKENAAGGGDWQDTGRSTQWSWCADMLPYVKKIIRGDVLCKEAIPPGAGDSDLEKEVAAPASQGRPSTATVMPRAGGLAGKAALAMKLPVLSKVQVVNAMAIAQQQRLQAQAAASMAW
jgi:hypothetical protein